MASLRDFVAPDSWYLNWCTRCPRELFIPHEATTLALGSVTHLVALFIDRYPHAASEFAAENHQAASVEYEGADLVVGYDCAQEAIARVREVFTDGMEDFVVTGEMVPHLNGHYAPCWHMLALELLLKGWKFAEALLHKTADPKTAEAVGLSEFRRLSGGLPLRLADDQLLTAQLQRELLLAWKQKYPGVPDSGKYQTLTSEEVEAAKSRRQAVTRIPSPNADRNKWIYGLRKRGVAHKEIIRRLSENDKGWELITVPGGINMAADAYAEANNLPKIRRSGGRPKRS